MNCILFNMKTGSCNKKNEVFLCEITKAINYEFIDQEHKYHYGKQ